MFVDRLFDHPMEHIMKRNIGGFDRILRIAAGAALVSATALGVIGPWGWLGIIPLATGLFRVCPAYALLGIRTCNVPNKTTSR